MQTDTPDVLLLTNTKLESQGVLGVFQDALKEKARPVEIGHRTYFDLGTHNHARVFLAQSEIDSDGKYDTKRAVKKGIDTLNPGVVIEISGARGTQARNEAERPFSSLPFFSSLKDAERSWTGSRVSVHSVSGDPSWILVEGAGDSNAADAAAFILGTLQAAPFVHLETLPVDNGVRSSLPNQPFFFGRAKELAIIADAISPDLRTWGVLIDGPGGIGKTSLAVRAGHLAPASHFNHKVFLSAKIRELTPQGEEPRTDFIPPNYLALLSELARELGDKDLAKVPENERADSVRRTLAGKHALIVIDNLETLPDPERVQLYKFLSRLPEGCKAIVTSRRRSDVDARVIRVDRLDLKDALSLIGELAKTNRSLAAATLQERQMLYEFTGGNPLLLGWTAGQLGRRSSQCRTVADACAFLKNASAENDPLEYIFGDLLDTFTSSETAVLAVLTHFTLPAEAKWIAECSGLAQQQAQVALEDLADRALIAADPSAHTFYLPPLAAKFLGDKRPEAVAQTGERLAVRAHAQAIENGYLQYERFSVLEAQWPLLSAAIPWLVKGENERLQTFCNALRFFLEFSGRWDDWQSLEAQGEQKAVASNDLPSAGWRAFQGGWVSMLRHETAQVLLAADRAEAHWRNSGEGSVMANALRLRGFGRKFENDTPAAFEAFQKALDLFRQVDAESDDVGNVLNDLAGLQRGSGALAEAEKNYLESLRIARKNGNNEGIAICTGNLGNLARSRRDWSLMEKFSREALSLSDQLGRSELIGSNCERLALALARQGRPADGLPYVKRAIDIFRKLGQKDRLGDAEASLKECEAKPAASRPS